MRRANFSTKFFPSEISRGKSTTSQKKNQNCKKKSAKTFTVFSPNRKLSAATKTKTSKVEIDCFFWETTTTKFCVCFISFVSLSLSWHGEAFLQVRIRYGL